MATAFRELKAARAEGVVVADPHFLTSFEHGLQVTVVAYTDNDDVCSRRAWNAGKHDEESNTARRSSVH
eukprot:993013-Lingulodinium_polyedra.AAC.1